MRTAFASIVTDRAFASIGMGKAFASIVKSWLSAMLPQRGILAATSWTGFKQGTNLPIGQAQCSCNQGLSISSATVQVLRRPQDLLMMP